jgi:hypothetical protein
LNHCQSMLLDIMRMIRLPTWWWQNCIRST